MLSMFNWVDMGFEREALFLYKIDINSFFNLSDDEKILHLVEKKEEYELGLQ
jgi:hypothetical protein